MESQTSFIHWFSHLLNIVNNYTLLHTLLYFDLLETPKKYVCWFHIRFNKLLLITDKNKLQILLDWTCTRLWTLPDHQLWLSDIALKIQRLASETSFLKAYLHTLQKFIKRLWLKFNFIRTCIFHYFCFKTYLNLFFIIFCKFNSA